MSKNVKEIDNILSRKQFYLHLSRTSESDKSNHDMKRPPDKFWFLLADSFISGPCFANHIQTYAAWSFNSINLNDSLRIEAISSFFSRHPFLYN